jgi:hypothetical protein
LRKGFFRAGLLALILLTLCSIQIEPSHSFKQADVGVRLEEILKRTGEYCEKVKNLALHYICKEHIQNTIYYYTTKDVIGTVPFSSYRAATKKLKFRGTKKESWVCDYQLIRKSGEMTERRNLLEENGKANFEQNVELQNLKYSSKYIVFGPVGFLSKYWQNHFSYEILRSEDIADRRAVVIIASPKQVRKENYNVGHIWIDVKDYSILRIQWEPLSIQNYEEEKIRLPIGEFKKTVIWNVDFGVEKKGIRFPSLQTVQELIIEDGKKRHVLEKTEFLYTE